MDEVDLCRQLGQVERVRHGGIAPADDGDGLIAEKRAVAGRAVGHARAEETLLALQPQLAVRRAHREDDRPRTQDAAARFHGEDVARRQLLGARGQQLGAHPLRVLGEQTIQLKAVDAVDAEIVFDFGRGGHLPAAVMQHRRAQPRAGGVQRRGKPRRAAAEDEEIVKLCIHTEDCPFPLLAFL